MNHDDYDAFRDKVCNDPLWAADEITRLLAEVDRLSLALIEARNPGIDMAEVKRTRDESDYRNMRTGER